MCEHWTHLHRQSELLQLCTLSEVWPCREGKDGAGSEGHEMCLYLVPAMIELLPRRGMDVINTGFVVVKIARECEHWHDQNLFGIENLQAGEICCQPQSTKRLG